MILNRTKLVHLPHRVHFLRAAVQQSIAVAAAPEGQMTIWQLGKSIEKLPPVTLESQGLQGISLHPSRPMLALVDGKGKLIVHGLDGRRLLAAKPPKLHNGAPKGFVGGFHDCLFDKSGDHLWCSSPISEQEVEIQLRSTGDWSMAATVVVKDPYGDSHIYVFQAGQANATAIWLNAGQNGQQVYWVTKSADGLHCDEEPNVENSYWPVFSPAGDEFLVSTTYDGLSRYRMPTRRWGKNCRCPDRSTDWFGNSLAYLDQNCAIIGTSNGRVFLVDVKTMRIIDEVIIEGYEPKTAEERYGLVGEKTLCTGITFFSRLGDDIALVSPSSRGGHTCEDRDDLIMVPVDSILDQSAKRRSTR